MINPRVLDWFQSRGIEPETVARTGIYSGARAATGEVVADPAGEIIVFPNIRYGQETGAKYRAAHKRFWQKPGGTKSFLNSDILDDPRLLEGHASLIITEGEPDMLTALQCGFLAVSVPDGAPPERVAGEPDPEPDPDNDQKFSYVLLDWERLKKIKHITLAVDNDGPGKRLAEELVRRLGRARCYWVEYPDGCKDLNDVLLKYGPDRACDVLNESRPYPVSGLFTLSEFPPEPPLEPLSTGWGRLDDLIKVFYPGLLVVTGFANAGKSTWTNQLLANLAIQHRWSSAIASFEMRLDPYVTDTLRAAYLDKPIVQWTKEDRIAANEWIERNFMFISPSDDDDDTHDVDWLIERAEAAVIRKGIRVLMIDPWNEIEHSRRRNESGPDYISRALQSLKRFGRYHNCLVIVVAHPTKEGARKKAEDLSLYDVADAAHFANKADLGVIVTRVEGSPYDSEIIVCKVRYQPILGRLGRTQFTFDPTMRLFSQ